MNLLPGNLSRQHFYAGAGQDAIEAYNANKTQRDNKQTNETVRLILRTNTTEHGVTHEVIALKWSAMQWKEKLGFIFDKSVSFNFKYIAKEASKQFQSSGIKSNEFAKILETYDSHRLLPIKKIGNKVINTFKTSELLLSEIGRGAIKPLFGSEKSTTAKINWPPTHATARPDQRDAIDAKSLASKLRSPSLQLDRFPVNAKKLVCDAVEEEGKIPPELKEQIENMTDYNQILLLLVGVTPAIDFKEIANRRIH
ncbi:MAG: hypothetical protein JSR46_04870 [Verrucomicrobia bacterium]|nr:hypothetical protein [Verrucomicrobiota bacterium]